MTQPKKTAERDRDVAAALMEGPTTVAAIATRFSLDWYEAYYSLRRLQAAGRVEKTRVSGNRKSQWALTGLAVGAAASTD